MMIKFLTRIKIPARENVDSRVLSEAKKLSNAAEEPVKLSMCKWQLATCQDSFVPITIRALNASGNQIKLKGITERPNSLLQTPNSSKLTDNYVTGVKKHCITTHGRDSCEILDQNSANISKTPPTSTVCTITDAKVRKCHIRGFKGVIFAAIFIYYTF